MGRWRNQKDREHNLTSKNLQKGGQTRFFFIKVQQKENFSSNKSRPKGMALKRSARHWAGFFFFVLLHLGGTRNSLKNIRQRSAGARGERYIEREREIRKEISTRQKNLNKK